MVAGLFNLCAIVLGIFYLEEVSENIFRIPPGKQVSCRIFFFNFCQIFLSSFLFFFEIFSTYQSLPSKRREIRSGCCRPENRLKNQLQPLLSELNHHQQSGPLSLSSLLNRNLVGILLSFFMINLQSASWISLVPLFAYTRKFDSTLSLSLSRTTSSKNQKTQRKKIAEPLFSIPHRH